MDTYKCDNCGHDKYIAALKIDAINGGTVVKCANCGAYMYLTNTGHFTPIAISKEIAKAIMLL